MESQLESKVALVTGGSRGIGRGIVEKLTALGTTVVFNYHRDEQSASELVDEVNKRGGKAQCLQADMAVKKDIDRLFDRVRADHGRLDILVNNAGIAIYRKVEEFPPEEVDRIFDINIKGVFYCCQHAARMMADYGSIINIGSTVTRVMMPRYAAYAASKAAVEQITRVLAKELGSRSIRVNTLSPGPVDTELFREGKTQEQISGLGAMAALGRIGRVDDIADMVVLLVDEKARWVTGQNILVNGGFAA